MKNKEKNKSWVNEKDLNEGWNNFMQPNEWVLRVAEKPNKSI